MRKVIIALVVLIAIAFLYFSFSELENVAETLKRGDIRFLGLAFILALVWLYNMAVTLRATYRLVGLEESIRHLVVVVAAANFVNVVAPSAGIGGIAIFLDAAKQRDHSTGRVTVAGALFILLDYAAFICILALGWVVLLRRNNLTVGEITASIILLVIACTMAFFIYLGYLSADRMGRALAWSARLINAILRPFIHREHIQVHRAHHFAEEFSEGLSSIKGRTHQLVWPFLFSLNNKLLLICILALSFLSFHTPFTIGTLVGGFSIGYLFVIVSPTPSGLGFVEGALPVALRSLRVPWEAAVLVTLAYRAATFWFPLGVGALAFRFLQRAPKE
ncbi:MAG: lysylphosphatidylglycerol synthase transmembrane domain-containing protein [Chloroflexota bacterium]